MSLKPYPEYKASGLLWLGEIPAHWDAVRLKQVAQVGPSKSEARRFLEANTPVAFLPMERVGIDGRVTATEMRPISEVWNGFTYFRRSDVLIAKITPCFENGKGACLATLPTDVGFGSTEFIVLRAGPSLMPEFLYRVSTLSEFRSLGADAMTGAAGQQRVPPDFVKGFVCGLPPLEDQAAIARFLTHADHRINRLIRAKRRLIELLTEQKQAIIHRAVTRGLDPNVRFKPSGIDWLGDVPEHWEVAPLRRFATKRCDGPFGSGLKSMHYTPQGIRVIRLQNIGHSEFRERDAAYISPEHYASLGDHDVIQGDLLIAGLGDERIPAGRACVAPGNIEPAMVKADCFRFRLNTGRAEPQFVAFQLSATAVNASAILSTGATRQRINLQTTAGRAIAIPPIHEQQEIVVHVTSSLRPLEKAIAQANREIDLLREYRTRLIADVVTGKLDVRGVGLPALDEADTLDDRDTGEDAEVDEMNDSEEATDA